MSTPVDFDEDGKGIAMTVLDLESGDDDDNVHDQLPSLEEYRASMTGHSTPNPDGSSAALKKGDKEDENVHDQLPSVDEIKNSGVGITSRRRECFSYIAVIVAVILVTLAIVLRVTIDRSNDNGATPNGSDGNPVESENPSVRDPNRLESMVQHLAGLGISSEEQLRTAGTPQYLAVDWLANKDGYAMTVPNTNYVRSRFVERYVLAVFYYATDGPNWKYDMDFLTDDDHCRWNDVFFTSTGESVLFGVYHCIETARSDEFEGGDMVWQLRIPYNNLKGQLPSEIKFLSRLDQLYLGSNRGLFGTLPEGIVELTELENISLDYCSLNGTLPEGIGALTALTYLGLGNNYMTGTIPSSLYELSSLDILGIDDNFFEGNIADFAKLTNLTGLFAEDNAIAGEITEELLAQLPNMVVLDLSANELSSSLPAALFQMSDLVVLDLNGNNLQGSIPAIPSQNTMLQFVALYDNELSGSIPTSIRNLPALHHLDISRNSLTSTIPSVIGELTSLIYLFAGSNSYSSQPMPAFLQKLTNLRELSLKSSSLTGTIPTFLGAWSQMQFLDLDSNKLNGTIPDEIGYLSSLDHLLLNRNQLTGSLPETFTLLYDLDLLLIDDNSLTGNAEVICSDPNIQLIRFVSDCDGAAPEFECSCCDVCCHDSDPLCSNFEWHANLDPVWEYGYQRNIYNYDINPQGST